ncbi:hypothetical protein [Spirillospora sp. NPDC029432]|uniref:ATP-binding protein n=1 Tax=Spirillospora sp. NPDC029432 TaxID=3154599 RepID=UPI0034539804
MRGLMMKNGGLPVLAKGGVCAWPLPYDETGPHAARSLLHRTMAGLGLGRDVIEDGRLAVSEVATNALRYGGNAPGGRPPTCPELWVWARTVPAPQLIVSVFDRARTSLPRASGAGLLDEHGKGLGLLGEVAVEWGAGPSRARLAPEPLHGKTVWFALPLPVSWPGLGLKVHPGTAAQCLLRALQGRGFPGRRSCDQRGISVLELPGLNIWAHSRHFTWRAAPARYARQPFIDLQETAECVVRQLDGSSSAC